MSLALKKRLIPETGRLRPSSGEETESRLNISVVFPSVGATLAALKEAGELAHRLGARITLLVPQIVPYPLPLLSPPVLLDWSERRFHVIANENPVETTVHLYLCRDRVSTLESVLKPHSIVVIGGPRCWWRSSEEALARSLRRAGHEVIFKGMERGSHA